MRQFQGSLIAFIVFFLSVILPFEGYAQGDLTEIVTRIEPSTVLILTYDKDGKSKSQGSGFFISQNGDIITNRHVLAGSHRAEVKTTKGNVYDIIVIVAEDKEGDIIRASVNMPLETARALSVSTSTPKVGERIAVIGSPLGLDRTVSDGIVAAVREIPGFGNIYQITAPISPGSSGSPVINMKGEVIGVTTFQSVEGQNLNFAIPAERIVKLKTGKRRTLGEWNTSQKEEWSASAEGLYQAGLTFFWGHDYEGALPYFEKAVVKDPIYGKAYFNIGICHFSLGRYTEAITAFKQAIRITPDYAYAYYNLGVVYDHLERYTEALEAYKQTIRIKADFEMAYYNQGVIYDHLERYTEAVEAYKQAIRIKPEFADAHNNLGVVYDHLEHHREAIDAYKQAIHIKPDFAAAHYNLGLDYLMINDRGLALNQYKILKNLDSNSANELFNQIDKSHSRESDWRYYSAYEWKKEITYCFLDMGSIAKSLDGTVTVWVKMVPSMGNHFSEDAIEYAANKKGYGLILFDIDCSRKNSRTLKSGYYDDGAFTESISQPTAWSRIMPDTMMRGLMESACH